MRRARALLPEAATLGRTRTDELAVVLPGCTATQGAEVLRTAIEQLTEVALPGGAEVPLRLAVGLAAYPEHAADADELYMAADAALADALDRDESLAVAL